MEQCGAIVGYGIRAARDWGVTELAGHAADYAGNLVDAARRANEQQQRDRSAANARESLNNSGDDFKSNVALEPLDFNASDAQFDRN